MRCSRGVVELEQSRDVVDVVVGEILTKFQEMQVFILEFYEILYFMRNYLPILSIENITGNSKYHFI